MEALNQKVTICKLSVCLGCCLFMSVVKCCNGCRYDWEPDNATHLKSGEEADGNSVGKRR